MEKLNKVCIFSSVLALVAIVLATIAFVKPGSLKSLGSVDISSFSVQAPSSGAWTAFDNVLSGELRTASSTFTSIMTVSATTTFQGLSCVNVEGTLADATTTLLGNENLFGATSTLQNFRTYITVGATSTISFEVGTSTTRFGTPGAVSTTSRTIIQPMIIATSSQATLIQGAVAADSNASSTQIVLGPTMRIVAQARSGDASNDVGGVIGTTNVFAGTYKYGLCR